jgi:fumarate reductase subunit C
MPAAWWLNRRAYFYFMLRELTAVFVAGYCVFLLAMLWRLRQACAAAAQRAGATLTRDHYLNVLGAVFDEMLDWLQTPWSVGLHFLALLFACYHAATWFNLTPQIMVIRLGEEKVPGAVVAAANYALWLIVSLVLVWLVL